MKITKYEKSWVPIFYYDIFNAYQRCKLKIPTLTQILKTQRGRRGLAQKFVSFWILSCPIAVPPRGPHGLVVIVNFIFPPIFIVIYGSSLDQFQASYHPTKIDFYFRVILFVLRIHCTFSEMIQNDPTTTHNRFKPLEIAWTLKYLKSLVWNSSFSVWIYTNA